ncbi:hypothetical protein TSAR_016839 [Trichomalopsis sarcophagae]|uniref:HTH CENPB-type domain-containing protein n=1 Tax=Trichomalopsis sarcophagae TaxID=543379 RepID=A0A232EJ32_9HYME|nr:hypothetical protein TSAR_016839 [Trichomalopsis sarcophagae]
MGPQPYLTFEGEEKIVYWINNLRKCGFPKIVEAGKLKTPFNNNKPDLSKRKAESISKGRAIITEEIIRNWFRGLKSFLQENNALEILEDLSRIFNGDETGIQICQDQENDINKVEQIIKSIAPQLLSRGIDTDVIVEEPRKIQSSQANGQSDLITETESNPQGIQVQSNVDEISLNANNIEHSSQEYQNQSRSDDPQPDIRGTEERILEVSEHERINAALNTVDMEFVKDELDLSFFNEDNLQELVFKNNEMFNDNELELVLDDGTVQMVPIIDLTKLSAANTVVHNINSDYNLSTCIGLGTDKDKNSEQSSISTYLANASNASSKTNTRTDNKKGRLES